MRDRGANMRKVTKSRAGSVQSIRLQTAELNRDVALLKAGKVIEREAEKVAQSGPPVDLQAFSRAYARWLRARAAIKADEFPEEARAMAAEERAALRQLFSLPALYSEDVFQKFEALEAEITDDNVIGKATDTVLPLALGSIKNDL
jgi:hypothetical protein